MLSPDNLIVIDLIKFALKSNKDITIFIDRSITPDYIFNMIDDLKAEYPNKIECSETNYKIEEINSLGHPSIKEFPSTKNELEALESYYYIKDSLLNEKTKQIVKYVTDIKEVYDKLKDKCDIIYVEKDKPLPSKVFNIYVNE